MFDMESKQLSSSKFKLEAQNSYLTLILLLIHDQLHPADKDYNCEPGDDLQTIRLTVMNSPGCAWTVEDMAAKANMSVSGFQRKYKNVWQKPDRRPVRLQISAIEKAARYRLFHKSYFKLLRV